MLLTGRNTKEAKGPSLSTSLALSLPPRAQRTRFLQPFLKATPLSNLSIIFLELDPTQVFLFSHSAEAQHGTQGLGTVW